MNPASISGRGPARASTWWKAFWYGFPGAVLAVSGGLLWWSPGGVMIDS